MSTWIARFDDATAGGVLRVAVKDIIDIEGWATTAGCKALAAEAKPAVTDAACLAGIRAAERDGRARLTGKTNLHELAFGVSGINPWYGTPANPLDPAWVPGGSSSGSAVAVAVGDADVALGTDTGGSIRIPAACCGIVGLKPTWGRVPIEGVRPLAPSLDTVGPMARDVKGIIAGMALLQPGFAPSPAQTVRRVGRLRLAADSSIDGAIDDALAATGWEVIDIELPGWGQANRATLTLMGAEAWRVNGALAQAHPGELGADVEARLQAGSQLSAGQIGAARRYGDEWRGSLGRVFERVDLLAWPTLAEPPPRLDDATRMSEIRHALPVNLAGIPALALPVRTGSHWPPSVQLAAPAGRDEMVVAGGLQLEAATS